MTRLLIALLALATVAPFVLAADEPAKDAPAAAETADKAAPAEPEQPKTDPSIDTTKKRLSYFLGWQMAAQSLGGSGVEEGDLDLDLVRRGIEDMLREKQPAVSQDDVQAAFAEFRKVLEARHAETQAKEVAEQQAVAARNKEAGEKFLTENAKKDGVKTTESGLQYKVIKPGTGATPDANDTVTVHYRGTLPDGTEFDSSHKRGEPAVFDANQVIRGWTEALQLMKEGATYELYIPSDLAYGVSGPGRPGSVIGPNQTLVFTVELIKVSPNE